MADFTIDPAGPSSGQIEFTFGDFRKEDGTLGEVEAGSGAWTLTPLLGTVMMGADGLTAKVRHDGSVGEATLEASIDGDIGLGQARFSRSKTIEFTAPRGATVGEISGGAQGPVG